MTTNGQRSELRNGLWKILGTIVGSVLTTSIVHILIAAYWAGQQDARVDALAERMTRTEEEVITLRATKADKGEVYSRLDSIASNFTGQVQQINTSLAALVQRIDNLMAERRTRQ